MKKSILVYASLMTRVIVDDTADNSTIIELAIPKLAENLMNSPHDSIDEIKDDVECPYKIGEEFSLDVGDSVIAPEPRADGSDLWNFGGWEGTIIAIKEDTTEDKKLYAEVQDGDGDVFCIDLERIELY